MAVFGGNSGFKAFSKQFQIRETAISNHWFYGAVLLYFQNEGCYSYLYSARGKCNHNFPTPVTAVIHNCTYSARGKCNHNFPTPVTAVILTCTELGECNHNFPTPVTAAILTAGLSSSKPCLMAGTANWSRPGMDARVPRLELRIRGFGSARS